jgi:hypothetical protein
LLEHLLYGIPEEDNVFKKEYLYDLILNINNYNESNTNTNDSKYINLKHK